MGLIMKPYKTGAKIGNKNALKNKWVIIKNRTFDGKAEYQVSDDIMGERTIYYDFDSFEDAKECLKNIRMTEKGCS